LHKEQNMENRKPITAVAAQPRNEPAQADGRQSSPDWAWLKQMAA
jgi:hypothetical protein